MSKYEWSIAIGLFTWFYFGAYAFYEVCKYVGKPRHCSDWLAFSILILLVIGGPFYMQAVYEVIIEDSKGGIGE